jgi:hypothetical protein
MSDKRDIINVASTTLPAPTSSAMPVTTAEGTGVATVVVPVSALAPEVSEGWAISQVADRIDGKATAEIQTEQRHRYVIEAPAQLTREQWIQEYSPPPPIGTSTPSDESLVLSNE